MDNKIRTYKKMRVYQNAIDVATKIVRLTRRFPSEEPPSPRPPVSLSRCFTPSPRRSVTPSCSSVDRPVY